MFNLFKKTNDDGQASDPFASLGLNKKMMITALKQIRNLNPAQKQQVKIMFRKQMKRDISKEEIAKGAEELGKQLVNEFPPQEIELLKKDLIDLFS